MWPFRSKRGGDHASDANQHNTAARGARGDFLNSNRRRSNLDTPTANSTAVLGAHGEKLARKHLRRAGLKILAANYRCPAGEVDLIALDRRTKPDTIVFVEVKTRNSDRYTSPAAAVNAEKQRRIRKVADYYLHQKHAEDLLVRYDIVSVVLPNEAPPRIEHLPDAF